jgi:hypothetical protein
MASRAATATSSDVVETVFIEATAQALLNDFAREVIQHVGAWVHDHAADYGLRLEGVRARRWRSVEDREWVEVIIEVRVVGDTKAVQRFWDGADRELTALSAQRPDLVEDLLTLHVHWSDPDWQ